MKDLKYSLGIDLGTSNCSMALSTKHSPEVEMVAIRQVLSQDTVGEKTLFPSAYYIPHPSEFGDHLPSMNWQDNPIEPITGFFALAHGSETSNRLITSAKSWLCDRRFDPNQAILPWKSEIEEGQRSPTVVSTALLVHLKNAFLEYSNKKEWGASIENTAITLTVPASFDEIARNQTLLAAETAGFENITLLEEPQAAFYSWLNQEDASWREQVQPGDLILVCDIGGGTSDMSLVVVSESEGNLELNRICVGNHLLLGGDNIDLALAYTLKFQAEEQDKRIDENQLKELVYAVRKAKESFSKDPSVDSIPLSVASKGSGLFESAISFELTRQVYNQVIDGFFPKTEITELPVNQLQEGLQELGLQYETEPIVSKHIAAFLHQCKDSVVNNVEIESILNEANQDPSIPYLKPTAILFNGGVFNSSLIKDKVSSVLNTWCGDKKLKELTGNSLDLAVAKGASAYGRTKLSGKGIRIRAGSAQSYYIGIESSMPAIPGFKPPVKAICIVPYGMEEGNEQVLTSQSFGLLTGKKVGFRFFSSKTRTQDRMGSSIQNAESDLEEYQSLQIEINTKNEEENGQIIPVELHSKLSELGTLELWMQNPNTNEKWKLEFDVRTQ